MTNVTLSINDATYNKMKMFSEIKWSDFIRKCIQKRVQELESINNFFNNNSIMTMFASEDVLKKDWDNELDERWNNV